MIFRNVIAVNTLIFSLNLEVISLTQAVFSIHHHICNSIVLVGNQNKDGLCKEKKSAKENQISIQFHSSS